MGRRHDTHVVENPNSRSSRSVVETNWKEEEGKASKSAESDEKGDLDASEEL